MPRSLTSICVRFRDPIRLGFPQRVPVLWVLKKLCPGVPQNSVHSYRDHATLCYLELLLASHNRWQSNAYLLLQSPVTLERHVCRLFHRHAGRYFKCYILFMISRDCKANDFTKEVYFKQPSQQTDTNP